MCAAKILLVEDDHLVANAICALLSVNGYEVVMAIDGSKVLDGWQDMRLDLIITDIVMPDVDGVRLIRSVRAKNPNIPVLAISGLGPDRGKQYLKLAKIIGANATLQKPIKGHVILSTVSELLLAAA